MTLQLMVLRASSVLQGNSTMTSERAMTLRLLQRMEVWLHGAFHSFLIYLGIIWIIAQVGSSHRASTGIKEFFSITQEFFLTLFYIL